MTGSQFNISARERLYPTLSLAFPPFFYHYTTAIRLLFCETSKTQGTHTEGTM